MQEFIAEGHQSAVFESRNLLVIARVLSANEEMRDEGRAAVALAQASVHARAAELEALGLRESFLALPENQAILAL